MRIAVLNFVAIIFILLFVTQARSASEIIDHRRVVYEGKILYQDNAAVKYYFIHVSDTKSHLLGPEHSFSDATQICLKRASESSNSIVVRGLLRIYRDGTDVVDSSSLECLTLPEPITNPFSIAKGLKLTEELHNEYMLSENYALADALLNATWGLVKSNVSEEQYKQILQEQRQWASKGRDEIASRYSSGSTSDAEAFAKAMQDRTGELASMIAVEPAQASYDRKNAGFTTKVQGNILFIEGDAFEGQNTCLIGGAGTAAKGWITIDNGDSKFYVLFTRKGAQVVYTEDQGCGMGVRFDGSFTRK